MRSIVRLLVPVLVALPVSAAAQVVSPTTPVHPSMPWSGITTPQGQLIRYIYVPPQPVMLEYIVPAAATESAPPPAVEAPPPPSGEPKDGEAKGPDVKGPDTKGPDTRVETPPEAAPPGEKPPEGPQIVRQQLTVPGYYVRETTVGFHYPERWTIEQAAPNVYRWRQIAPQFVPK